MNFHTRKCKCAESRPFSVHNLGNFQREIGLIVLLKLPFVLSGLARVSIRIRFCNMCLIIRKKTVVISYHTYVELVRQCEIKWGLSENTLYLLLCSVLNSIEKLRHKNF